MLYQLHRIRDWQVVLLRRRNPCNAFDLTFGRWHVAREPDLTFQHVSGSTRY
jgi:hypothetical protein